MSLNTLKKQNSLSDLLGAAEKENTSPDKKSYVDERLWKPELDKTGNGYAVIGFYQRSREKICLGRSFGIMHFKVRLANGILRILSPHLDRKTLYQR